VRIGDQRRRTRKKERVAVGRRAGRELRADHIAAARAILEHDRLADPRRKRIGDGAADQIGTAAGGLRADELDRAVGPGLALSLRLHCDQRAEQQEWRQKAAKRLIHGTHPPDQFFVPAL
jgi:hypothetical protein